MSQEPRPGDLVDVELTLNENQVHDILGGLAWGADYAEEEFHQELAQEMRDTRDEVVKQFKAHESQFQRRDEDG